jgi:hypothetical protein
MLHDVSAKFVGSMHVILITNSAEYLMVITEIRFFYTVSVSHHFLRPGMGLALLQRTWGEVL